MIDMGNYAKTYMPGLYAIVYFDVNAHRGLEPRHVDVVDGWVQVVRKRPLFQHPEPVDSTSAHEDVR